MAEVKLEPPVAADEIAGSKVPAGSFPFIPKRE
jgi:hypothetical protein